MNAAKERANATANATANARAKATANAIAKATADTLSTANAIANAMDEFEIWDLGAIWNLGGAGRRARPHQIEHKKNFHAKDSEFPMLPMIPAHPNSQSGPLLSIDFYFGALL